MLRSILRALLAALSSALAFSPGRASAETFVPCGMSGRVTLPLNTEIKDADGRPLARFSGGETTVTVSGFALGTAARARVETGGGRGNFRVRGFVETAALPVVTAQMLPVSAGHTWIGKERQVRVVGSSPDKIKVERVTSAPLRQTLSTWTTCSKLKLTQGTPPGWSPGGFARGYVLRRDALELFSGPGGSTVGALQKNPSSDAVLFFSTEQTAGFVHVEYHSDVVVDAWARIGELSALPPGETMDQIASMPSQRGAPRLALPGNPRVVQALRDVPLRAAAKDASPVIGVIEPDAEAYVIDVMAGWVSVMPKALDVVPLDGGQFWVKKSELGL